LTGAGWCVRCAGRGDRHPPVRVGGRTDADRTAARRRPVPAGEEESPGHGGPAGPLWHGRGLCRATAASSVRGGRLLCRAGTSACPPFPAVSSVWCGRLFR
jgi:hypothetical protein